MITPYPPGIPAIAPGEVYTEATVDYLERVVAADGYGEVIVVGRPGEGGSPPVADRPAGQKIEE